MSLLAALTIKVSAILLLALIGARCLRTRSASARHWVLAVGVVSAVAAPALHVLPIPAVVRVAPVGPLAFEALQLRPSVPFPAPAAVASDDVVGRVAVTVWLWARSPVSACSWSGWRDFDGSVRRRAV